MALHDVCSWARPPAVKGGAFVGQKLQVHHPFRATPAPPITIGRPAAGPLRTGVGAKVRVNKPLGETQRLG
ncbi:hypothetical protein [Bradyrhizobium sp. HKCCYLS20291]|uniref:hypothetical protein n=1 Tax=Bradyrhizobium sp. HKCCYLS20291 TaxID=3420766 RepID=UPI003EC045CF